MAPDFFDSKPYLVCLPIIRCGVDCMAMLRIMKHLNTKRSKSLNEVLAAVKLLGE